MPKPTFLNLPEKKQMVLIDALKKEFSRAPLSHALVSNIVKEAKISRGSFYQYFEDKEDAFFYLLDKYTKEMNEYLITCLKEVDGDIFTAYLDMFRSILESFKEKENRDYFKNMFLHMNYKVENAFTERLNKDSFHHELVAIQDLIDKRSLHVFNEKELMQMLQMLTAVTFQHMIYYFVKEQTVEETMEEFKSKLELLKRGFYKREGK